MKKISKSRLKVKLSVGFIYKDEAFFVKALKRLSVKFGKPDFLSASLAFNCTDYYKPEMGEGLKRRFVSFKKLISIQDLYRVKLFTNRLEKKYLSGRSRQINIDPGYIDLAKLVLATTKDYAHRIYLGKGIFAEVALTFRGNSFSPNEWTYPDYRTQDYINIFNQIRKLYLPG